MTDLFRRSSGEHGMNGQASSIHEADGSIGGYEAILEHINDAIATAQAHGYSADRLLLPANIYEGRMISQYLSCAYHRGIIIHEEYLVLIAIYNKAVEELRPSKSRGSALAGSAMRFSGAEVDSDLYDHAQRAAGECTRSPYA